MVRHSPPAGQSFFFIAMLVIIAGGVFRFQSVAAQTFIQPPAAPPGGNTAGWLTTGTTDERKLGPLLLGSVTTPVKLCLNAADLNDPAKCVASWSEAVNLAGGPFVPLRTAGLSLANQSEPNQYFTTPTVTNLGAASVQGSGPAQAYSLIAEANPDFNAGYGLFAGDDGVVTNYASQFSGRVGIGNTILSTGLPGPVGQLCLNDTATYIPNGATGCITTWGDLVGTLSGFVKLQPTNPPIPEAGTAAMSEVGNFGNVVFGHPPTGQPAQTFCGDGLCSTNINEDNTVNANYCPIDCAPPNPPTALNLFADTATVNLQVITQAQTPSGAVRVLLVRSANPSFILDLKSGFVPQNGVVYSNGQVINGVVVILSGEFGAPSGFSVFDSVPQPLTGLTYYYRLYQANRFPIYNQSPKTLQVTPHY